MEGREWWREAGGQEVTLERDRGRTTWCPVTPGIKVKTPNTLIFPENSIEKHKIRKTFEKKHQKWVDKNISENAKQWVHHNCLFRKLMKKFYTLAETAGCPSICVLFFLSNKALNLQLGL